MSIRTPFRTVSEELFADYLDGLEYEWEYEPPIAGRSKVPDFRVRRASLEFLCEVKERSPKAPPPGARMYDPIEGGRKLIEAGRNKFGEFDEHLCALVVFNNCDFDTRLDPICIFGAMLGRLGMEWGFDSVAARVVPGTARNVFLERDGKMISHYDPFEPRAATANISSVVALGTYRVPNPAFECEFERESEKLKRQQRRDLTPGEKFELRYSILTKPIPMTLREVPRVVVCTNPFARHALPDELFCGQYDERWSIVDGQLRRVFAGCELETSTHARV
jgi:hypothetical protein